MALIKYDNIMKQSDLKQESKMTEMEIRRAMAESGRTRVSDLMRVMKHQYTDRYDNKLARKVARELVSEIPKHARG